MGKRQSAERQSGSDVTKKQRSRLVDVIKDTEDAGNYGDEVTHLDDQYDINVKGRCAALTSVRKSSFDEHFCYKLSKEEIKDLTKGKRKNKCKENWEMTADNMSRCKWIGTGECFLEKDIYKHYGLKRKLYKHWSDIYNMESGGRDFNSSKQRSFFFLWRLSSTQPSSLLSYVFKIRQRWQLSEESKIHLQNFLFATRDEDSPLEIIDFGLSDFSRPDERLNDIVGSAYYVAPEVLHRSYSIEADIWSIGVIAYILLCGSIPFWSRTESGIFRSVLRADPNFNDSPWPNVSPEAKDFVKRLLNKDHRKRMTAAQALGHPWLRDEKHPMPLDVLTYKLVKSYIRATSFKRAALKAEKTEKH